MPVRSSQVANVFGGLDLPAFRGNGMAAVTNERRKAPFGEDVLALIGIPLRPINPDAYRSWTSRTLSMMT